MKKQIFLASFLLYSNVAFNSEQQPISVKNLEINRSLLEQNHYMFKQLKKANRPRYFKGLLQFSLGAAIGTSLTAFAFHKGITAESLLPQKLETLLSK